MIGKSLCKLGHSPAWLLPSWQQTRFMPTDSLITTPHKFPSEIPYSARKRKRLLSTKLPIYKAFMGLIFLQISHEIKLCGKRRRSHGDTLRYLLISSTWARKLLQWSIKGSEIVVVLLSFLSPSTLIYVIFQWDKKKTWKQNDSGQIIKEETAFLIWKWINCLKKGTTSQ